MELLTEAAGTRFDRYVALFADGNRCRDVTVVCGYCDPDKAATLSYDGGQKVQFKRMIDGWLQTRPTPSVQSLLANTKLSLRQLERNCKALYGKPPKVLARQVRALRAAAAIALNPRAGYDVVEYGFYDQPHMIREIKHFTGMTPGQIRGANRTGACPYGPRTWRCPTMDAA